MSDETGKSDKADLIGEGPSGAPPRGDSEAVAQDATGNEPKPSRQDEAMVRKPDSAASRKKERLAAALRDNLKRRKAQMRGRRAMGGDDEDSDNS